MVKMRVKNTAMCPESLKGKVLNFAEGEKGDFLKDDQFWYLDVLFLRHELEPVEDMARPTEEPSTESRPRDEEDVVNHPQHYQFSIYEPIKVIQAWDLSFALGNVVKYIARAGRKDSSKLIEDLEKAKRYLELELEHLRKK